MTKEIEIRGASGLGDAFYVYPVAKYYQAHGHDVTVRTKFPEVFSQLDVKTTRFFKMPKADVHAVYSNRKAQKDTNQYQDVLINSKVPSNTKFSMEWDMQNGRLCSDMLAKAGGSKICVVSMPHQPFDRPDNYGDCIQPNYKNLQIAVDQLNKKGYMCIVLGKGVCKYKLRGAYELQNRTSVSDFIDICSLADGFIGQMGFIIPVAEAFNKPLFVLVSRNGLNSKEKFISQITGEKVLSSKLSVYSVDDDSEQYVKSKIDGVF